MSDALCSVCNKPVPDGEGRTPLVVGDELDCRGIHRLHDECYPEFLRRLEREGEQAIFDASLKLQDQLSRIGLFIRTSMQMGDDKLLLTFRNADEVARLTHIISTYEPGQDVGT